MKKLTAMVSVYNAGEFIENRINNLRDSTLGDDLEICVLNANSPDKRDRDIPKKMGVKYIETSDRIGVYAAWNRIIKETKSVYLANANADDLIAPNGFERLITALEKNKTNFAYTSWYSTAIPNQNWNSLRKVDPAGKPGHYKGDLERAQVGHFPLWQRSLHEELGPFDETFKVLGDAEWWARCLFKGNAKFFWVDSLLACYLWRDGENYWHKNITSDEWKAYHARAAEYQKE